MPLSVFASVAFLLGVAGIAYCTSNHLCLAGHFAHPDLITSFDYVLDGTTHSCLLAAIAFGHFSRRVGPRLNIFPLLAIELLQTAVVTCGYWYLIVFELPFLLIGIVISVRTLVEHFFISSEKWSMNEPVVSAP